MRQVLDLYLEASNAVTNLAPATKSHHKICLQRLEKTWPELGRLRPRQIPKDEIERWAGRAIRISAKAPPGARKSARVYTRESLREIRKAVVALGGSIEGKTQG
jgi:hypothetical protein